MEFSKDHDFQLVYHSWKAYIVVDALSYKKIQMSILMIRELKVIEKFNSLNSKVFVSSDMLIITNEFMKK